MAKKIIEITCEGVTETVPIENLTDFQGSLKDLTDKAYEKAKQSILDHGFSFAVHVWKNKGHIYILDGHQRIRAVRHMCEFEGYYCPEIPVVSVQAKTLKQAKLKLLAAASQFGDVNKEGLYEYMTENKITFKELNSFAKFQEFNLGNFNAQFFKDLEADAQEKAGDSPEPVKISKEVDFNGFECPKCGHQFFEHEKVTSSKPKTVLRKRTAKHL